MAEIKKISTELQLLDKFLDTSGDAGTSGQVLSSTASGINWTTPTTGTVTGTGTTNRLTKFTDGANGVIGNSGIQDASNAIAITINGNEEVGINKTNPTRPLHVSGIAQIDNGSLQLGGTSSVSGNNPQLRRTNSSNDLAISTGGSDRITVLGTGNVGIGTTSPGDKLSIAGSLSTLHTGYTTKALRVTMNSNDTLLSLYARADQSNQQVLLRTNGNSYFNGGNVGIGTTSPSRNLHVHADSGNAYLQLTQATTGTTSNDGFQISMGAAQVNFINRENGNMVFETNNTEKMRITNAGNVGIGTTSPLGKLQVNEYTVASQGNQGVHGEVSVFADNGDESLFLGLKDSAYPNRGWAINPVAYGINSSLQIKEHGSTAVRMTIQSGGNVGIGTTSPSRQLDVEGVIRFSSNSNQAVNGYGEIYTSYSYGKGQIFIAPEAVTSPTNFHPNGGVTIGPANTSPPANGLIVSGNVGIGTTTPTTPLHIDLGTLDVKAQLNAIGGFDGMLVEGTNASYNLIGGNGDKYSLGALNDGSFRIYNEGGAGYSLTLNNSGKLGLGTTDPQEKLDIAGGNIRLDDGFSIRWATTDANIGRVRISGNEASDFIQFVTDNSEKMRLTNTGLSIGTTTPLDKLHVANGNIRVQGLSNVSEIKLQTNGNESYNPFGIIRALRDTNTGAADFGSSELNFLTNVSSATTPTVRMVIDSDGDVGIGTDDPGYKLDVNGSAKVTALGINAAPDAYLSSLNARLAIGGNIVINTASPLLYLRANGGTTISDIRYQNSLRLTNGSGSTHLTISSGGKVGIGTTSNTTIPLHVNTTGSATVIKAQGIAATIEIESGTAGNATLYQRPNTTGDKEAEFRCTLGSTYGWSWKDDNATSTSRIKYMKLDQNPGTLTVKGDVVAYGSPSDRSLKENIKPIDSALDKVMKLQGVTFDWKPKEDVILDIKEDIGFIAQDVQKVVPELIRENSNGLLSMRHQGVAPILLEAIKELKAEIDLLKSKPCTCNKCNCNI